MTPRNVNPFCLTEAGLNSLLCKINSTRPSADPHLPEQTKGSISDYLPTPARLADVGVDVGGKSKTDVAIDNSDHNVVDWTVNLEQAMGTVIIVLAILALLYCCRYGFNSICDTACCIKLYIVFMGTKLYMNNTKYHPYV